MIDAASASRRLLLLTATRWLPVGVTFGLVILLPVERGLSVTEVGTLLAIQGFVVLALELPTGGLSDSWGRRPLLLTSGIIAIAATAIFVIADSFWLFALALGAQGVFRALDSGPLESWFVDRALASDPAYPIARPLSQASTVLGITIAVGAALGGALVAWHPIAGQSALVLPFLVALAVMIAHTVLVAVLIREPRRAPTSRRGLGGALGAGLGLVRRSPVLRSLVLVEVFWAVAMVAFETLTPLRMAEQLDDVSAAGALFGPVSAAAWALFAAGSWIAGRASRRLGVALTAILARVLNGAFVLLMGVAAGLPGLIAGYWLAHITHGAAGPMHTTLLHREATDANRGTVLSINSMVAGGSYSVGILLLAPLAEATTTATAIIVAGAFSILGAALYLPALRREHRLVAERERPVVHDRLHDEG